MSAENDVIVEKCRELWKQIVIDERELEGYKEDIKACQRRIDNKKAEIRRILTEPRNQMEIPMHDPNETPEQEATPVETPTETPTETPVETPTETPAEEATPF